MPVTREDYSVLHSIGNTNIQYNSFPTLRGGKRRHDPDGSSGVPYFPSVATKVLRISYSNASLIPQFEDITIPSNSFADILATINAVDPTNLEALDMGGFLALRNKNGGSSHFVQVNPWTTPANDAAPDFGIRTLPPGNTSYAGELSSSPGIFGQNNPQGTFLIGQGEDLSSATLNRPLANILELIQDIQSELNKDVIVYKEIPVTFEPHPINTSSVVASIEDSSLRLPIQQLGFTGIPSGTEGVLDPHFGFLDANNQVLVRSNSLEDDAFTQVQAINVLYANDSTALDTTQSFSNWLTPDGRSIYGASVPNKTKHPSVTISAFDGNIAKCPGADFESHFVASGDYAYITSSVNFPFNHTGWFMVQGVVDSETISLRPLSQSEKVRIPAPGPTPASINTAGVGTIRIAMGYYIPAHSIRIVTNIPAGSDNSPTSGILRVAVGVPLKSALSDEQALQRAGSFNQLARLLSDTLARLVETESSLLDHITGAADSHAATQITGFTTGGFADSTTATGTNIRLLINNIVSLLAASTGSAKIGGAATGTDIAAGTLATQISNLATGWLKMSRDNTISGAQTFIQSITASGGMAAGGAVTAATTLAVNGTFTSNAAHNANGLITANAGITLGSNQHATVSGTGLYKHGLRTIVVPIQGASIVGPITSLNVVISGSGSGANNLLAPICLDIGKRILALRVVVTDNTTGPTTCRARIFYQISTGFFDVLAGSTTNTSSGSGAQQTLQATNINGIIAASTEYFVIVDNVTGSANCVVRRIEIDYDQP